MSIDPLYIYRKSKARNYIFILSLLHSVEVAVSIRL
jgi:hypothetical protein